MPLSKRLPSNTYVRTESKCQFFAPREVWKVCALFSKNLQNAQKDNTGYLCITELYNTNCASYNDKWSSLKCTWSWFNKLIYHMMLNIFVFALAPRTSRKICRLRFQRDTFPTPTVFQKPRKSYNKTNKTVVRILRIVCRSFIDRWQCLQVEIYFLLFQLLISNLFSDVLFACSVDRIGHIDWFMWK